MPDRIRAVAVPLDLYDGVHAFARDRGTPVKHVVIAALRAFLAAPSEAATFPAPIVGRPRQRRERCGEALSTGATCTRPRSEKGGPCGECAKRIQNAARPRCKLHTQKGAPCPFPAAKGDLCAYHAHLKKPGKCSDTVGGKPCPRDADPATGRCSFHARKPKTAKHPAPPSYRGRHIDTSHPPREGSKGGPTAMPAPRPAAEYVAERIGGSVLF